MLEPREAFGLRAVNRRFVSQQVWVRQNLGRRRIRLGSKAVLKHTQSKRSRAGRMSFEFRASVLVPPVALLRKQRLTY